MSRPMASVAPAAGGEASESPRPRCPSCGVGELFSIEVTRNGGEIRSVTYCGGDYDRERRTFLRRSCGYSGSLLPVTT